MVGRTILAVLVLASVALAGCSDDGDEGNGEGTTSPTSAPTTAPPTTTSPAASPTGTTPAPTTNGTPREPVTWEVLVQDNAFSPAELTVQVGDTVRFVYDGSNPHTATADNGEFDSGDCPGTTCFTPVIGRSEFEYTTESAGEIPYVCEVHSNMTGTITVLERYDEVP